jgi:hypothetical protein
MFLSFFIEGKYIPRCFLSPQLSIRAMNSLLYTMVYRCPHLPLSSSIKRFRVYSSIPALRTNMPIPWTKDEKRKVYEFTADRLDIKASEWTELAKSLGRPWKAVRSYWVRNQFVWQDQKHGQWTPKEDQLLEVAVDRVGSVDFKAVAHFVPKRSHAQCRRRFRYLRERDIPIGRWTIEEKALLENGLF